MCEWYAWRYRHIVKYVKSLNIDNVFDPNRPLGKY